MSACQGSWLRSSCMSRHASYIRRRRCRPPAGPRGRTGPHHRLATPSGRPPRRARPATPAGACRRGGRTSARRISLRLRTLARLTGRRTPSRLPTGRGARRPQSVRPADRALRRLLVLLDHPALPRAQRPGPDRLRNLPVLHREDALAASTRTRAASAATSAAEESTAATVPACGPTTGPGQARDRRASARPPRRTPTLPTGPRPHPRRRRADRRPAVVEDRSQLRRRPAGQRTSAPASRIPQPDRPDPRAAARRREPREREQRPEVPRPTPEINKEDSRAASRGLPSQAAPEPCPRRPRPAGPGLARTPRPPDQANSRAAFDRAVRRQPRQGHPPNVTAPGGTVCPRHDATQCGGGSCAQSTGSDPVNYRLTNSGSARVAITSGRRAQSARPGSASRALASACFSCVERSRRGVPHGGETKHARHRALGGTACAHPDPFWMLSTVERPSDSLAPGGGTWLTAVVSRLERPVGSQRLLPDPRSPGRSPAACSPMTLNVATATWRRPYGSMLSVIGTPRAQAQRVPWLSLNSLSVGVPWHHVSIESHFVPGSIRSGAKVAGSGQACWLEPQSTRLRRPRPASIVGGRSGNRLHLETQDEVFGRLEVIRQDLGDLVLSLREPSASRRQD